MSHMPLSRSKLAIRFYRYWTTGNAVSWKPSNTTK